MLRKAIFAGGFYDASPERLRRDFDKWFQAALLPELRANIIGVVSPHAGYMYSGFCASHSFKAIGSSKFQTAVILHPSHRGNHFDFSVSPYGEYQTPLGNLSMDKEIADLFKSEGADTIDAWYHQNEHSMEVQLPFLKYINPEFEIVPVMIGRQTPDVSRRLAEILLKVIGHDAVIVVSSDLSHYHTAAEAEDMDKALIKNIVSLAPQAFYNSIRTGETEACGFAGILSLLDLAGHLSDPIITQLQYTHSGFTSGDNDQVVGYLSAVLTGVDDV